MHLTTGMRKTQENAAEKFWNKMAAMHKRGVSHNDLHGGNIFWDEDEEEINILDLGLAKVSRLSALMEGTCIYQW